LLDYENEGNMIFQNVNYVPVDMALLSQNLEDFNRSEVYDTNEIAIQIVILSCKVKAVYFCHMLATLLI
jgi:hypothetical protein